MALHACTMLAAGPHAFSLSVMSRGHSCWRYPSGAVCGTTCTVRSTVDSRPWSSGRHGRSARAASSAASPCRSPASTCIVMYTCAQHADMWSINDTGYAAHCTIIGSRMSPCKCNAVHGRSGGQECGQDGIATEIRRVRDSPWPATGRGTTARRQSAGSRRRPRRSARRAPAPGAADPTCRPPGTPPAPRPLCPQAPPLRGGCCFVCTAAGQQGGLKLGKHQQLTACDR